MNDLERLTDTIRKAGFAFVQADAMRAALLAVRRRWLIGMRSRQAGTIWGWILTWRMAAATGSGGSPCSARRPATMRSTRKPHQPHYQSRDYNTLNGGIERWFAPILPEIADGATLAPILRFCRSLFDRLSGPQDWHIELHQFRIEARRGIEGHPTPEGRHRDGVDHVLVLLVNRRNIQSGVTTIHDLDGDTLGSFTLTQPLDSALVEDRRVMHGVTPVEPVDPRVPGFRDVLVVTFRREAVVQ